MAASAEPRVALYFDFDNIVISRYDQLHGDGAYRKDTSRSKAPAAGTQTAAKLGQATVDVDAVLDFAATFGTIALARAYADWSTPVNASYRGQLIDRAVDLVQLFPLVKGLKNGADIRLAVDAVEDLFRLDGLTHIVIVAGDSDYVPLAQKAKRLGAYVVGIGVAGGTSRALSAACDEFADYDALLATVATVDEVAGEQVADASAPAPAAAKQPARGRQQKPKADAPRAKAEPAEKAAAETSGTPSSNAAPGIALSFQAPGQTPDPAPAVSRNPGRLLLKALELLRAKNDQDWQPTGAVKNQMLRMDPSFQERKLGFGSFTEFVKSRAGAIELDEAGNRVRLHPKKG
ncbi:NYN domain-containing protein [Agromyces protaetiae]|uniref:NYN domain-containing protein n=1 Tax=Agromyces protaetiae TaxID=2509455 RepID=A0A4P6F9F8_9MICO|nr:NYN domain-containing protein [Agromyces protaetiae]QAY72404.1 NYN domain-containing protein [Agromyces protaetiae]